MRAASLILCLLILHSLTEDIEAKRRWRRFVNRVRRWIGKRDTVKNEHNQPPFYQFIVFESLFFSSIKHSHYDDLSYVLQILHACTFKNWFTNRNCIFLILYFDVTIILLSLSLSFSLSLSVCVWCKFCSIAFMIFFGVGGLEV